MKVRESLESLININNQYQQPSGIIGLLAGRLMAQQHLPENLWTVSLLSVQPADRVLEVGFGPGVAIELLATRIDNGLIAGVDRSRTMIVAARWRNRRAVKDGRVELFHGEATELPFDDASFDKAFSIHTLYFWPDPIKALTELRRVLRPQGILVLTFLPRDYWPVGEAAEASAYTGREVVQLMREAGFAQVHIEWGPEQKAFREIAVVATKSP